VIPGPRRSASGTGGAEAWGDGDVAAGYGPDIAFLDDTDAAHHGVVRAFDLVLDRGTA